jgi:endonuclease/exonuclease/phosphatase family metal-dependent hydrolase
MNGRHRCALLLAVLVLLPSCEVAMARAQSVEGDHAKSLHDGGPIRIMSFNIRYATAPDGDNHWQHRKELVVRTLRNFEPDVFGLQEAMPEQVDYIREQLGAGYEMIGYPRIVPGSGHCVPVFYRTEVFERLEGAWFWLTPTPHVIGVGWDASMPRMAVWARLRRRSDGLELMVMNTHFDHIGVQAKVESARLLRRKVAELAGDGAAIVMGDFNAAAGSEPYAALVADQPPALLDSFRQLRSEADPQEDSFHAFGHSTGHGRIDWILHSPHLKTIEAAIDRTRYDGRFPSDHYPVTAVVAPAAASTEPVPGAPR